MHENGGRADMEIVGTDMSDAALDALVAFLLELADQEEHTTENASGRPRE